VPRSTH